MNHLIDTIKGDLNLRLDHWYTSQQDRAATNITALDKIYKTYAKPTRNDCCSHTFSNAGKKMMEGENAPKYGSMFQKYWQAVIQYPGQAREKASAVLGEVVKESGGVRFF